MSRRLLLVSLKYSPGLRKEFQFIGSQAGRYGFDVAYLVAPEYRGVGGDLPQQITGPRSRRTVDLAAAVCRELVTSTLLESVADFAPDTVLFYNFHPINATLIRRLKRACPRAEVALFVHDPKRELSVFRPAERCYYALAEVLEHHAIRHADHVIVASDRAKKLFERHFPEMKQLCHVARLLVPDAGSGAQAARREFITMIGHCNSSTGHEDFFSLVEYASRRRPDLKFALITPSDVSRFLEGLGGEALRRLIVINKPVITEAEINTIVGESFAVLRLDRQLVQSGVVPVAFMNGASVIARDIPGLRQHIRDGQDGILLPSEFAPDQIIDAIDRVKADFGCFSRAARDSYIAEWSAVNFPRYYQWLLKDAGAARAETDPLEPAAVAHGRNIKF